VVYTILVKLFYANLEVVQDDDHGVVLQSSIAGHLITVDPQVISHIIRVPVLEISASPYNEVVLPPSLDDLREFFCAPKVRNALLPSGLVPCHPSTACWPRSFSRIFGRLPGVVI
jgi:hypothetical protein